MKFQVYDLIGFPSEGLTYITWRRIRCKEHFKIIDLEKKQISSKQ